MEPCLTSVPYIPGIPMVWPRECLTRVTIPGIDCLTRGMQSRQIAARLPNLGARLKLLSTLHSATGVLLPAKNPAYFTRMVKKVDPRSRHPASWGEFTHWAHIFAHPFASWQNGKLLKSRWFHTTYFKFSSNPKLILNAQEFGLFCKATHLSHLRLKGGGGGGADREVVFPAFSIFGFTISLTNLRRETPIWVVSSTATRHMCVTQKGSWYNKETYLKLTVHFIQSLRAYYTVSVP